MAFCIDLTKTVCVNFIHDRALQLCPPSFQIGDPWGGSYLMEALTDQVYESALNIINEVQEVHLKISTIVLKAKHNYVQCHNYCVLTVILVVPLIRLQYM